MGKIHSIESFGTVDGPGVRFVVFFEGCPMRCLYCHNPDTWHLEDGQEMSAEEILSRMERNRSFYRTGGITATGGEPMLQIDFLTELFAGAKERGIHTCLDTSGIMFPGCGGTSEEERERLKKVDLLLSVTDLVMLDIKHMDAEEHRKLTGQDNEKILALQGIWMKNRYRSGSGMWLFRGSRSGGKNWRLWDGFLRHFQMWKNWRCFRITPWEK